MMGGGMGAFAGMAGVHIIIKVVDKATKVIHEIIQKMGGLQAVAGVAAAVFGGAVIAAGIKRFAEFEDVMVDVQKTAGLTHRELLIVTNQIRELARNSRMSHIELGKIAFVAGQMGVAKNQIAAFTKSIEMMSVALDLSGDETARVIGKIKAIFKMSQADLINYIDIVNQLTNEFNVMADEVIDAVLRSVSSAKQFDVPLDRLTAMATAIVRAGVSADRAGTGLRRMFQFLVAKAPKLAEAMGVSLDTFRSMVNENAMAVIETLIKMADNTEDKFGVMEVIMEGFGKRASEGIGLMATSVELYTETLAIATNEAAYAGSTQDEYNLKMATTAAQFDLMTNAINDALIVIGAEFAPMVMFVIGLFKKIIHLLPYIIKFTLGLAMALMITKNKYIGLAATKIANIGLTVKEIKWDKLLTFTKLKLAMAAHRTQAALMGVMFLFTAIVGAYGGWTGAIDLISFAFMGLATAIAVMRAAAGDITGAMTAAMAAGMMGVMTIGFRAQMEDITGGLEEEMEGWSFDIDELGKVFKDQIDATKELTGVTKQVNSRDMSITIPLYITFEKETIEGTDKAEFEQFVYDKINEAVIDGLKAADLYEVVP